MVTAQEQNVINKDPGALGGFSDECSGLVYGKAKGRGWEKPGWSRACRTWCRRKRGWS